MDDKIFVILILFGLLFYFVFLPYIDEQNDKESRECFDLLSDLSKTNDIKKIDKNICSKQCCKFVQWPVPFNTIDPKINSNELKDYIGSNLTCNGGQSGGGCVCLNQNEFDYLADRGKN